MLSLSTSTSTILLRLPDRCPMAHRAGGWSLGNGLVTYSNCFQKQRDSVREGRTRLPTRRHLRGLSLAEDSIVSRHRVRDAVRLPPQEGHTQKTPLLSRAIRRP
ncbi:hypothetical protein CEXT_696401 [Caerostris extrusa]|uniref:Uncharacterized protein n=1 Tax=Caerostris extrusa TaxID=172846 RepID=A0AAV4YCY8_CAEEX|nr:hypothetical protein CEXT_696401 [Caerostris extrusa]